MVKSKKNRKTNLDVIKKVSKRQQIKSNPFEVHVNKSKFNILGQKSKNDIGLPGVSRNKAIQKRKVTLLQEYKVQDKNNKFYDKRIGENNKNMTKEDKIMARFTAEKMKSHNKSLFNLDDDVVLTHQGRTLEEIEQFEDPRSDDEDEDGRNNDKLDADFVKQAHFGGGMLSVASKDGELSRKDLITQLIFESKKRKAEKQLLKENTQKLTEQLDTEWKDLLPLMNTNKQNEQLSGYEKKNEEKKAIVKVPPPPAQPIDKNSFDYLVRELKYEATGKPSDKLKSEDEIIRQEKERLEKLELERLKRMNLYHDKTKEKSNKQRQFQSADDLDDGFALENINDDDDDDVSDNEIDKNMDVYQNTDKEETDEKDSDEEETEDTDEDDESEEKTKTQINIKEKNNDNKMEQDEEKNEEDNGDSESDTDSFDDLQEEEDDDESESEEEEDPSENDDDSDDKKNPEENEKKLNKIKNNIKVKEKEENKKSITFANNNINNENKSAKQDGVNKKIVNKDDVNNKIINKDGEYKSILKNNKNNNLEKEMKIIKNQELDKDLEFKLNKYGLNLPFTFNIPQSYEELLELFQQRNVHEINIILERMIKVNHWSLGGDNKIKLNKLIMFLLQFLNDNVEAGEPKKCWQILNVLTPHLFDLTQMDPDSSGNYLREVIQEKYENYCKNEKKCPSVDSLVFLKLVSTLFPTSDARHYVTTPAMVFLLHTLGRVCVSTPRDISIGVFLCTLAVEYIDLSKRYLPELINFIYGNLLMATNITSTTSTNLDTNINNNTNFLPIIKPFKLSNSKLLFITKEELKTNLNLNKDNKTNINKNNERNKEKTNEKNNNNNNIDKANIKINAEDFFNNKQNFSVNNNNKKININFKIKIIINYLNIIKILINKYKAYNGQYIIFNKINQIINRIKLNLYNNIKLIIQEEEKEDGNQEKEVRKECVNSNNNECKGKHKNKKNDKNTEKNIINLKNDEKNTNNLKSNEKMSDLNTLSSNNLIEIDDNIISNYFKNNNCNIIYLLYSELSNVISELLNKKLSNQLSYVVQDKEKPKILRLFNPEIQTLYPNKYKLGSSGGDRNLKEKNKLIYKYKKEMKGAIREIRKDNKFLSKIQFRKQNQLDMERKRKVKEIIGFCSNQEGEIRNIKRKK